MTGQLRVSWNNRQPLPSEIGLVPLRREEHRVAVGVLDESEPHPEGRRVRSVDQVVSRPDQLIDLGAQVLDGFEEELEQPRVGPTPDARMPGPRSFVEEEGEVADDRLTVRPGLVLEVDPQTPVEVERPGHVTGDEPDHVHLGWLGHAANLSKRPPRHGLAQIEAMIAARCKEYISRGECGSWRRNACAGRRSARPLRTTTRRNRDRKSVV